MSKTFDSGCGLQKMFHRPPLIYALGVFSTPPKPMVFHRFLMVSGNAPWAPEPARSVNNYEKHTISSENTDSGRKWGVLLDVFRVLKCRQGPWP